MGKPNSKGRTKGKFAMVTEGMMDSPAWLDLSGVGAKLLLRLILLSKGNNGFGDGKDRGRLFMSEREGARLIGCAKNTAAKALADLDSHGFIRQMSGGKFAVKLLASTWRLTFQPYPHGSMAPTNEWMKWTPDEKKPQAQKLTTIGSKTDHFPDAMDEIDARIEPVTPISPDLAGSKTGPHIESTKEGAAPAGKRSVNPRADNANGSSREPSLAEIVRVQVEAFCSHRDDVGRARLASAAGLKPDELRRFCEGHFIPNPGKLMALRSATKEAA